jgi:hypothetical protein
MGRTGDQHEARIGTWLRRHGRSALLWSPLAFAACQLVLLSAMERWRPELHDPEYGLKRTRLRERLAEEPGRPLFLMLGSSRVGAGFRPEKLPAYHTPDGASPLVHNFGKVGAGPVTELVYLRRLLADGIHPRWVFVEYFPAVWFDAGELGEIKRFYERKLEFLTWEDLPVVRRYTSAPARLYRKWLQGHLVPWFSERSLVLKCFAPGWDSSEPSVDDLWLIQDRCGWLNHLLPDEDGDHYQPFEQAKAHFGPVLQKYEICPRSDAALRELVALCRQEGIQVGVVFMPEGTAFRGLYPAPARAAIAEYLQRMGRENNITVIDARDWVADKDFIDTFHLHPRGATAFTVRFGREVLQPLLAGHG